MTQREPDLAASSMATKVNLRELVPGERVMSGDVIIEVVDNPADGMWIRGRYVHFPANPSLEGTEDQIFAADITDRA